MRKFANLPLFQKIVLAPALAILALLFLAGLVVVNARQQNSDIARLNDVVFHQTERSLDIKDKVAVYHAHLFGLISTATNESDAARLAAATGGLKEEMTALGAMMTATFPQDGSERSKKITELFKIYGDAAQQVVDIGSLDPSYGAIMMGDADSQFRKLRAALEEWAQQLQAERVQVVANLRAKNDSSLRQTLVTVLLVSLASIAAALLISREIARPILRLTEAMRALAAGDTGTAVEGADRRDEVGAMAQSVLVFKENAIEKTRLEAARAAAEQRAQQEKREELQKLANKLENSVGSVVHSVSHAAGNMQSSAEAMTEMAENASHGAANVSLAIGEASGNVNAVASAAEQMSASVEEISRNIHRSSSIAQQAAAEATRTRDKVQALDEAAQKIGDIVNLIKMVANQTNLLALNATIEAARAGEVGKGFAVVAAEVKALARQSSDATEKIAAQIAAIQGATQETVEAIQAIDGTIVNINEISSAVAAAMEQQSAAIREITRNTFEAAQGTKQVASSMETVTHAVESSGSAAKQVLAASSELDDQARVLKSEMTSFLASIVSA